MDTFDTTGAPAWQGKEVAGQPADPAGRAPGARPPETLAPGGGSASVRLRLFRQRRAPFVDRTGRPEPPCTSMEEIYTHYQQFVWRRLRRSDIEREVAEEIHQEVFLTMDRRVHKKGIPDNVAATLTTITTHLICNHLRRRERCPQFAEGVELDDLPASQPDVEQRVNRAQRKRLVEVILAKMPRDAAMLLRCIDLGGLTCEDLAEVLQRPLKTVKTQHFRARARFRDLVERLYEADLGGKA